MNINAAYYSSKGNRKTNEDNISLLENLNNVIAVIADGLGGEGNGDIASRIAVQTISGQLSGGDAAESHISSAVTKANEEIIKLQINGNKMKSTVAVLYLSRSSCFAAHVGDTRIYQFRKNKLIYQSIDHSVSQMSVNVGEIKADGIRKHVDRNKLTNALGSKKFTETDLTTLFLQDGDAFLLCSDGFWEYVIEDEMCEDLNISNNADEWLCKMRSRVESRISPTGDNHSAIVILIKKES